MPEPIYVSNDKHALYRFNAHNGFGNDGCHELLGLKLSSLQLGASCYNRLLDLFGPGAPGATISISDEKLTPLQRQQCSIV